MKRIVLSCNDNPDYEFYLPITARLWREVAGYEPLVIRSKDLNVTGRSEVLATKLSRYFAACMDLPEDDLLMIGDVDLWPIDGEWLNQQKEDEADLHLFYANAFEREQFPACYISARVFTWRVIFFAYPWFKISDCINQCITGEFAKYTSCEKLIKDVNYIKSWSGYPERCQFVDRPKTTDGPPADRIDRYKWPEVVDCKGMVDAHLPRPGTDDKVWKQVEPIIEQTAPHLLAWANDYREHYIRKCVGA